LTVALSGSVGKGGKNVPADVRLVQQALNITRESEQRPPIAVDGVAGPETYAAILDFQKRHTGASDDRVDPQGPTFQELERRVAPLVEARVRASMAAILDRLSAEFQSRGLPVSGPLQMLLDQVNGAVRRLRSGAASPVEQAIFFPQRQPFAPRLAVAVAAAAPAGAAAAAAEAAMLALLALIALLLIIQLAPAMGKALEDLARQIQILMSKLVDQVKEAIREIEDLIKRNSRAGMRCSQQLILFRQLSQQLLDLLVAPRPGDELGRARRVREIADVFEKWQQALRDLLACLQAGGAV
jgi:peptidoglycan hydrolase-like protein with peptidoglycan-binding domain